MAIGDNLVWDRVIYLAEQIYENVDLHSDLNIDYYDVITRCEFSTGLLKLADKASLVLFERYEIAEYQLAIIHYAYVWFAHDGRELLRADNAEHHDVITFPTPSPRFPFRQAENQAFP